MQRLFVRDYPDCQFASTTLGTHILVSILPLLIPVRLQSAGVPLSDLGSGGGARVGIQLVPEPKSIVSSSPPHRALVLYSSVDPGPLGRPVLGPVGPGHLGVEMNIEQ